MATQLMISGITSYDAVRDVDAIVFEMEQGIFTNSARLVDQVLRDARINSVLNTRVLGLLGKPLEFEPAKDTAAGRRCAEDCETDWPAMFERSALVELLTWGIMQGVGIGQIVEDQEPWKLEVWHPWALSWDEYDRQYYLQTRENSRLYIVADGKGGYRDKNGTRWLLYTPFGYGNSGRRGLLRSIHRLYLERAWAHRDRARYSEIFGQPLRFGIAPDGATKEERTEYKKRLSLEGAEPVVVGNQGTEGNRWDLKLVEASGKSTVLFQEELSQIDKEIATLLLGQSQSTDGQSGLGSNDQAGEVVRLDIMRADGDGMGDTLHGQFLVPYHEFMGVPLLAPWPKWKIDPPEDRAKKAQEFKTLIDGIVAAKDAGVPIDERAILEDYGVPMISEEEQAAMDAENQQKAMDIAQVTPKQPQEPAKANGNNGKPTEMPMQPPAAGA
jgi:phage gp29-like protein